MMMLRTRKTCGWPGSAPSAAMIGISVGPKGLERLLGIPDVEHLNLPVGLESRVIEPAGRGSSAGRFELFDRLVVHRR